MPIYKAPVEDFKFLLHEFLKIETRNDLPGYSDLTPDLTGAILDEAGKFCEEVLQPLNQSGDEEGCHFENGVVRTPAGFREAYRKFAEAGWMALGAPTDLGGAGLPPPLTSAFTEMSTSANHSLAMYPWLTMSAYGALLATGDDWMRQHVAPKMITGAWTGTMCLTEPHCGTDLKLMKTKAVPQADGSYRMTGTKIFISGGDHDLTDNIIHMIIAKIPDENGKVPDDLGAINFFMVPKMLIDPETGEITGRNGVSVGNIEKKMGIKGNSTCVLNMDDAVCYRLKGKPARDGKLSKSAGMAGMFAMMNAARMGVGIQGIAAGEVAYQNGADYARQRLAGRALTGTKNPGAAADPIIVFPDVRRLLLSSRAFVEGARALALWVSLLFSAERYSSDPELREEAGDLAQLMTPVIKAYFTDKGYEAANAAMQVYGGHGYIRDNGVEQFVRDARITQIYEGANGIQALDLVARKMGAHGGRPTRAFFARLEAFIRTYEKEPEMAPFTKPLQQGYEHLSDATGWLMQAAPKNPDNAGAGSYDMLNMFGIVTLGYMWAQMAQISLTRLKTGEGNAAFYKRKLTLARYWMEREMPMVAGLAARAKAGADGLMALDAEDF